MFKGVLEKYIEIKKNRDIGWDQRIVPKAKESFS